LATPTAICERLGKSIVFAAFVLTVALAPLGRSDHDGEDRDERPSVPLLPGPVAIPRFLGSVRFPACSLSRFSVRTNSGCGNGGKFQRQGAKPKAATVRPKLLLVKDHHVMHRTALIVGCLDGRGDGSSVRGDDGMDCLYGLPPYLPRIISRMALNL